jgi:hypothetical protein
MLRSKRRPHVVYYMLRQSDRLPLMARNRHAVAVAACLLLRDEPTSLTTLGAAIDLERPVPPGAGSAVNRQAVRTTDHHRFLRRCLRSISAASIRRRACARSQHSLSKSRPQADSLPLAPVGASAQVGSTAVSVEAGSRRFSISSARKCPVDARLCILQRRQRCSSFDRRKCLIGTRRRGSPNRFRRIRPAHRTRARLRYDQPRALPVRDL